MLILSIETSTRNGSLALRADGRLLESAALPDAGRRHGQTIVTSARDLFSRHGFQPRQCDGVAVSVGPGSFTGLRVGVVFAKTFAWMTKCPVTAVHTSDVLARQAPLEADQLWTLIDAQRGAVYRQRYQRRDTAAGWTADGQLTIEPIVELANHADPQILLTGPLLQRSAEPLAPFRKTPTETWLPTAAAVAELGAEQIERDEVVDCFELQPLYIRSSAAEEKWEQQQARKG